MTTDDPDTPRPVDARSANAPPTGDRSDEPVAPAPEGSGLRALDDFGKALVGSLVYALSLPERALRALSALAGGTSRLLTEALLPDSLRGTSTYRITVGLFEDFLSRRLGGVEDDEREELARPGFLRRKLLGNALEAAGLLTTRLSPLWVLALAGDAVGGGRAFLNKLVERLKANEVLSQEADISDWDELLDAVQKTAGTGASAIDQPPLSREELAALSDELRAQVNRAFAASGDALERLTDTWTRMEQTAEREGVPLERVGGAMALDAGELLRKGGGALRSVGETGIGLLDEGVLESYRRTLRDVGSEGLAGYAARRYRPFVEAAGSHFSPARSSWTERLLGRDPD